MIRQFAVLLFIAVLTAAALAQLPDAVLTPGVVRTTSAAEICAPSFRTKPFRHTTAAMKHQACKEYGITVCPKQETMEIDHLIPLELGGLDDVKNLWPQMSEYPDGSPGFHVKDKLENELKRQVCAGEMKLSDAQQCIRSNWIACYQHIVKDK